MFSVFDKCDDETDSDYDDGDADDDNEWGEERKGGLQMANVVTNSHTITAAVAETTSCSKLASSFCLLVGYQ